MQSQETIKILNKRFIDDYPSMCKRLNLLAKFQTDRIVDKVSGAREYTDIVLGKFIF
jgi:hypothetical protein